MMVITLLFMGYITVYDKDLLHLYRGTDNSLKLYFMGYITVYDKDLLHI